MILFYPNSVRKMLSKPIGIWQINLKAKGAVMTHARFMHALILVGAAAWLAGCVPPTNGGLGNYNYGNLPYDTSYSSHYPSNGYETEYRKAQSHIKSQDRQAVVNGITQRMLNSGWYPESSQNNQLLFTKVRNEGNQRIYYKTVYTLLPKDGGYTVYASMKLKTTDNPYTGSLDEAARKVDDKTESILKNVKQEVERTAQVVVTPTPSNPGIVSVPQAPVYSEQAQHVTQNQTVPMTAPVNLPPKSVFAPDEESRPTPVKNTPTPELIEELHVAPTIRADQPASTGEPQTRKEKKQEMLNNAKQKIQSMKNNKEKEQGNDPSSSEDQTQPAMPSQY